jgi:hypothetical protein
MAWYRFATPIKQSNFLDFGLSIGMVCEHLMAFPDATQPRGHTEILDIRLRAGKLAFDTSTPIPAEQIAHLGLEAG